MSDSKSKSNDADWGFAGFDFAKLIESCQISGVDMTALIDTEKKNIDALMEVNRSAYDGWRNLMAQQAEVFQETMKAIAAEAGDESVAGRRTEIAREGLEKALANMRQLAETATESQKQTMEILAPSFRGRNGGHAQSRRQSVRPAGGSEQEGGRSDRPLERSNQSRNTMDQDLREAALEYHRLPTPGKISVVPTTSMATQRDLALAYSPGVAEPCLVIAKDPLQADELTARSNLVAVVTNGTAVLGLGNIGPLASKPVMEGKACLFKKFAGIDVFDIELAEEDPDALIETIARMEPTFGGINLEDIKAPECFYIEQKLRARMKIPVFHDDQHGTAIIAAAAILNGLKLVKKDIADVKLVCSGAGAAALACLDLIVSLGLRHDNIIVTDAKGVVYAGRTEGMDDNKARYAVKTDARKLGEIIPGCRHFSRPVGGQRAHARHGQEDGARSVDLRHGQPDTRNHAGGRAGGPPRRDHRDGTFGLPQPDQQCAVLSVHLQGRAGLRRDHDQRGDEACDRSRAGGSGHDGGARGGRRRLQGRGAAFRPRLSHSQAVRPAADRDGRAGGGQGGCRQRCRQAPDRRYGGLSPAAGPVRLPVRQRDAAGVLGGEGKRQVSASGGR